WRAAPLWPASRGDTLHRCPSRCQEKRRRKKTRGGPATGSQAPERELRMPLHAHPRFLCAHGFQYCPPRRTTRQDIQRLPALSQSLRLRRDRHGARPSACEHGCLSRNPHSHTPGEAASLKATHSPQRALRTQRNKSDTESSRNTVIWYTENPGRACSEVQPKENEKG